MGLSSLRSDDRACPPRARLVRPTHRGPLLALPHPIGPTAALLNPYLAHIQTAAAPAALLPPQLPPSIHSSTRRLLHHLLHPARPLCFLHPRRRALQPRGSPPSSTPTPTSKPQHHRRLLTLSASTTSPRPSVALNPATSTPSNFPSSNPRPRSHMTSSIDVAVTRGRRVSSPGDSACARVRRRRRRR
jgi:hypothetical protein